MTLLKKTLFLISCFVFVLFLIPSCGYIFTQRNLKIIEWIDGDTFTFVDSNEEKTARAIGIDSPELHDGSQNFQPLNEQGRNLEYHFALQALKTIESFFLPGKTFKYISLGKDVYDRELVDLKRDNSSLSEKLLELGLARASYWWLDSYLYKKETYFKKMEESMRNKRGMWKILFDPSHDPSYLSIEASKEYFANKSNGTINTYTMMEALFKNWKKDRNHYPQNFLNEFKI